MLVSCLMNHGSDALRNSSHNHYDFSEIGRDVCPRDTQAITQDF